MIWKVILYMNETYSAIKGGRRYFGEMKNNLEHGLGFYDIELWNQKFVGEFLNDKATGIGLKIQGSGTDWERKIVCEFNNNSHEGIGMYKWPSGATYVGEFKDDRAYGMRCFRIWNGNKYFGKMGIGPMGMKGDDFWIMGDGKWTDSLSHNFDEHGFCKKKNKEIWPDGTYYVGEFDDHENYCGTGTLIFSKSRFYEGEFLNGYFHGQGIFYHGNEYVMGEFKDGHVHGYGEAIFNTGSYKGYWQKNRFHGKGILKFKDETYDGEFYNININDSGGRDTGFRRLR